MALISIDGIDFAGKSTITAALTKNHPKYINFAYHYPWQVGEELKKYPEVLQWVQTKNYLKFGPGIRQALINLSSEIILNYPDLVQFLYLALADLVRPLLIRLNDNNYEVILARSWYSTVSYPENMELSRDLYRVVCEKIWPKVDRSIFLTIDVEQLKRRMETRINVSKTFSVYENVPYLIKVNERYLDLAKTRPSLLIDTSSKSIEAVEKQIIEFIKK